METLIVDAEGKVTIPSEVLHKRGLRPGDAVTLVESAEGVLVYQGGGDPKTLAWWHALSHEEQQQVEAANVYTQICTPSRRLYITAQTAHILRRCPPLFAAPFLEETHPLQKGRYLRRWARCWRELSFTPEDAI